MPFFPRRLTANEYEGVAAKLLGVSAVENGHQLMMKVRLVDILDERMMDEVAGSVLSYALRAHLDFVMIDEMQRPLFAVEVDGSSHEESKQIERDSKKDQLCEATRLPLLRVSTQHLSRRTQRWQLVNYLCEAYYNSMAFYGAQVAGHVPLDEVFFHGSLITAHPSGGYEFSAYDHRAIRWLESKYLEGLIPVRMPDSYTFRVNEREVRTLAFLPLAPGLFACSHVAVRSFSFRGITPGDVCSELANVEIAEAVRGWISGQEVGVARTLASLQKSCDYAADVLNSAHGMIMMVGGGNYPVGYPRPRLAVRF